MVRDVFGISWLVLLGMWDEGPGSGCLDFCETNRGRSPIDLPFDPDGDIGSTGILSDCTDILALSLLIPALSMGSFRSALAVRVGWVPGRRSTDLGTFEVSSNGGNRSADVFDSSASRAARENASCSNNLSRASRARFFLPSSFGADTVGLVCFSLLFGDPIRKPDKLGIENFCRKRGFDTGGAGSTFRSICSGMADRGGGVISTGTYEPIEEPPCIGSAECDMLRRSGEAMGRLFSF